MKEVNMQPDEKEIARRRAVLDDIAVALRVQRGSAGTDLFNDLRNILQDIESEAWHRGIDMAGDWAQHDREATRNLLLQVAARLDSKDRADGIIRYEVYPDPGIYGWSPTEDRGYNPELDEYIAQEDARLGYGPQTGNGPQD